MPRSNIAAATTAQGLGLAAVSLICVFFAAASAVAQPAPALSPVFVDMPKSPESFTRNTLTPEAEMRLGWRAVVKCQRRAAKPVVLDAKPASAPDALWPLPGPCPVYTFEDLDFSRGWEQRYVFQREARADCSDTADKAKGCKRGLLSLGDAHMFLAGGDKARFIAQLAALKSGQSLKWGLARNMASVEAGADLSIGGVPCRTYRWSAQGYGGPRQRDGLLCRYAPQGATTASWIEVV